MAQIGTVRLETQNSGAVDVPVFEPGDSASGIYEFVRVETASGPGFIPVTDPADATYPYLRVQSQNNGIVAVTDTPGSDIPDSAIARYDAQSLSGFSEGDTVSTWPDEEGTFDATGSAPTYRTSGINGHASVEFDGTDDSLTVDSTNWDSISQPITVFIVLEMLGKQNSTTHPAGDANDGNDECHIANTAADEKWNAYAGSNNFGSTVTSISLVSARFDGSNSVIREDGSQTGSGNSGAGGLDDYCIGSWGSVRHWDGYIGEIVVCDAGLTDSEMADEESRLAGKWDITI